VPDPAALERIAATASRTAADLVGAAYGSPGAVGSKSSPTDVVTQTDVRAEEVIRRCLLDATPEAGFLGEESGTSEPAARLQWVVDPLDGTVNFLYVLRGELFSARLGGGARCNGEAIAVSDCTALPQALVVTGFSYQADQRALQGEVVHRLLPRVRDIRCFGSTALELCWVACGRADAYYQGGTEIWDRAAGALIAAEAGATIELACPENDDLSIAATPGVFDELWPLIHFATA
jgi:myo-inositol-1(or 4)-monophosphatase